MPNEPATDASAAGNKRKRTAQACGPCRTKKTKCDGLRPSCTPCTSLGYTCDYPLDSSAPSARQVLVNRNYLEVLEARIMRLESERGKDSSPVNQSPVRARNSPTPVVSDRTHFSSGMGIGSNQSYNPPEVEPPREPPIPLPSFNNLPPIRRRVSAQTTGIDGMGLLLGPDTSPAAHSSNAEREVYGEASGITFHRLLLDTLLPGYNASTTREDTSENLYTGYLGLPPSDVPFIVHPDDLPTRTEALHMWDYFAQHTVQIYPFVDLERLQASYDELLEAVRQSRQVDPLSEPRNQPAIALHFVIFALVQNLSEAHRTQSDVFWVALRMLRKHIDWPHSIVKVQTLLIGAMIMQGVDCPSFAWDLLGSAIRSAYALGLHDPVNSVDLPVAEREYRLRTWWACYIFDRIVTLSIGRPSAVTNIASSLPLPSVIPGQAHEKNVRFFAYSIRLHRALSDLITNPLSYHTDEQYLERIVANQYHLEKEYANWADSLPAELSIDNPTRTLNDPLVVVLALRGLTMRLLLHRRVVLLAIRQHLGLSRSTSRAGSQVQLLEAQQRDIAFGISLAAVIETAGQIADLLEKIVDKPIILNAPWYLLFYAMNAFMSLISTFLLDLGQWSTFIKTPGSQIASSLHSLYGFVQKLSDRYQRQSASQALVVIEQLLGALGFPRNQAQPNTSAPPQATAGPDLGAWFNNITDLGSLPHLDLDELCRTLDLRFEDGTWTPQT